MSNILKVFGHSAAARSFIEETVLSPRAVVKQRSSVHYLVSIGDTTIHTVTIGDEADLRRIVGLMFDLVMFHESFYLTYKGDRGHARSVIRSRCR